MLAGFRSSNVAANNSTRKMPVTAVGNGAGESSAQIKVSVAYLAAGAAGESVTRTTGAPASWKNDATSVVTLA